MCIYIYMYICGIHAPILRCFTGISVQVTATDMHHLTCTMRIDVDVFLRPPLPPILKLGMNAAWAREGPTENDMHHPALLAKHLRSHVHNIKIGGRGGANYNRCYSV